MTPLQDANNFIAVARLFRSKKQPNYERSERSPFEAVLMDEQVAGLVVIAFTAVGAVVWLAAVATLLRAGRERRPVAPDYYERFEIEGTPKGHTIVGSAEVAGAPDELSAKLASALARGGLGRLGPVKILAQERGEVLFESAGGGSPGTSSPATLVRRGRVRFEGFGARSRVEYAVESNSPRVLLVFGWAFVGLGLLTLIAVPTIQFLFVVPNPNSAIRSQALQTIQMCHVLWPPFLLAFLARQPGRLIRAEMDALVHNLPYT
jgi:hypothetical protein